VTLGINPYAQVMKTGKSYTLYQPPSVELNTPHLSIMMGQAQEQELNKLMLGTYIEQEELIQVFGASNIDFMISNNILVESEVDVRTSFSRTEMFFSQYLSKEQTSELRNKSVLVLGCGGIGSSVAWLLTCAGIEHITLLDFDIIEYSNLNRMFMFTPDDVGKKKTLVLSHKLKELNPHVRIDTLEIKIETEWQLRDVCLSGHFDLIIKALDTPSAFPSWLDAVCKSNGLSYVTGITLRDRVLIGPSFISEESNIGWSDIIATDSKTERIYGTIPSIGLMLFHAADEVALEAIKVLLHNYDALKFKGVIYSENIFSGKSEFITSKRFPFSQENVRSPLVALNVLAMILSGVLSCYAPQFNFVSYALSILSPFVSCTKDSNILKLVFIDTTVFAFFLSWYLTTTISPVNTPVAMVTAFFILTSILGIFNTFLSRSIIEIIRKISK